MAAVGMAGIKESRSLQAPGFSENNKCGGASDAKLPNALVVTARTAVAYFAKLNTVPEWETTTRIRGQQRFAFSPAKPEARRKSKTSTVVHQWLSPVAVLGGKANDEPTMSQ